MTATAIQLNQLQQVNSQINAIPYDALPGPSEPFDWWTDRAVPGNSFVCRDYVLAKADRLLTLGWAKPLLTIVLCWTEPVIPPAPDNHGGREYHAVLCINANGDAWILDSRADGIYEPSSPAFGYLWDRQQVPGTTEFRDISSSGPVGFT